ncbi:MAG: hypothetical protein DCF18_12400 [Cyanobium sp.]|nr:MAG: hypothetical protein DCF18_12400 [Cyanobium sp.]
MHQAKDPSALRGEGRRLPSWFRPEPSENGAEGPLGLAPLGLQITETVQTRMACSLRAIVKAFSIGTKRIFVTGLPRFPKKHCSQGWAPPLRPSGWKWTMTRRISQLGAEVVAMALR